MNNTKLPQPVKDFVQKRACLRSQEKYKEADIVRKEIERLGYRVQDTPSGVLINPLVTSLETKQTTLSILGSGEMQSSGYLIHDYVLKQLGINNVQLALITTPAGFQPNVKTVYKEYKEFFQKRLKNYHPNVNIIFANTKVEANNPKIIKSIQNADYIVTGPGSPTYTVRHLKNTLLLKEIIKRIKNKQASLSLSSAAAIAFSKYSLPVYEIYKVGEHLHWIDGLNVYKDILEELTIIPHFNNNEGGEKLDTSRCYIGKDRFEKLSKMLPEQEEVWGIDEHTGMIIDLETKQTDTIGKGTMHKITYN